MLAFCIITKKFLLNFIVVFCIISTGYSQNRVTFSNEINPKDENSAILNLSSKNKGFLLPRMLSDEINDISDPAESLIVFNDETKCIEIFVNGQWNELWCYQYEPLEGPCEGYDFGVNYHEYNYDVVEIGDQCWFAENLRTSKYNDGENIDKVSDSTIWWDYNQPAYCYYRNDYENYGSVYGFLYNWFAVETGKLCPVGWKVPSDNDWKILEGAVDSQFDVGDSEWDGPDEYRGYDAGSQLAYNSELWLPGNLTQNTAFEENSDFNLLPGGWRQNIQGTYRHVRESAHLWTSTPDGDHSAIRRRVHYEEARINRRPYSKGRGYEVRCIRDN